MTDLAPTDPDLSYKRALARGALAQPFDAIVIGSGAGGLTSAALLALEGQRVLVLERHAVPGGCLQVFKRNGYEWDVGLHYMGEVHRPHSGLARLFHKLTRGQLAWAPMPEIYNRIVIEDRCYDYHAGAEAFKARMKDYFPAEAAAIDRYVALVQAANRAAKGYFGERALPPSLADARHAEVAPAFKALADQTVLQVMRGLTDNAELIAVLCGHFGDYALLPDQASFAVHAMVISHYIDGASYPVGGAARVAETLADTVRAAGGLVLVAAEVQQLLLHQQRVVGVVMADGHQLEAPVVLSAIGIGQTLRLLPTDGAQAVPAAALALRETANAMPLSQCYVALNIGIEAANAELGMHPANLWTHPSNDLAGNWQRYAADPQRTPLPLHFISQPSAKDPSWPERYPGRSTIDICSLTDWRVFEPFAGTGWMRRGAAYDALKARISDEMLAEIYRHYPQVKGRIAHHELATPLSFNHFLNRERGDFMSFAQTPQRFAQRWMRAPAPVDGLFFSGQDVAAAGVSGAMVGALVACSAVLGRDLFQSLRS
ncbi:MAG: NAD(P)/FAD-dependent oxidoreductase [Burkholderiaceae bacterium]|nr:NAD(P)/FAD-dependent oxidoreductase [Burkholderiaceae bacterium]